jgi:EAL domain-containing protein (putative c-di-GMP-specific phosphodiesterase class I)
MGDVALARIMAHNIAIVEKELEGSVVGCINDSEIACLYASDEGLDSVRMRQVLEWMRAPHDDDGMNVSADISASVSSRQNERDRFDMLLRRANGALYHAEETRSEDAVWYNPEIIQDLREAVEFRGDIARSIANGEFVLEFQPIVMLKTGSIEGVQALAVWQHPQLGPIRQNRFFSVFEKNGYIRDVGLFAISRSFEFLHRFKMRNPQRKLPVCIVLSLVQLIDPLFVERVTELQREWSIKDGEVAFVILKNAGALDDPQILRALGKLRDLGFRLAVDYAIDSAGLSKLSSVRSETLVIRPALQRNIEHPGTERTILRSVCRLAAGLEMFSLAVYRTSCGSYAAYRLRLYVWDGTMVRQCGFRARVSGCLCGRHCLARRTRQRVSGLKKHPFPARNGQKPLIDAAPCSDRLNLYHFVARNQHDLIEQIRDDAGVIGYDTKPIADPGLVFACRKIDGSMLLAE